MAFHYPVSKRKKKSPTPTRASHRPDTCMFFCKQSTVTEIFKRQSSVMCLQICCKFFEVSLGTYVTLEKMLPRGKSLLSNLKLL